MRVAPSMNRSHDLQVRLRVSVVVWHPTVFTTMPQARAESPDACWMPSASPSYSARQQDDAMWQLVAFREQRLLGPDSYAYGGLDLEKGMEAASGEGHKSPCH